MRVPAGRLLFCLWMATGTERTWVSAGNSSTSPPRGAGLTCRLGLALPSDRIGFNGCRARGVCVVAMLATVCGSGTVVVLATVCGSGIAVVVVTVCGRGIAGPARTGLLIFFSSFLPQPNLPVIVLGASA